MYYRQKISPQVHEKMKNAQFQTTLFLVCAALVCLALIDLSLYLAYKIPKEDSQTAAAWFQGVGSVAAIFIAIAIAAYQASASRKETERTQHLVDGARKRGVLAVAAAANHHAELIGAAMSQTEPRYHLYQVYDRSIIDGMVGALSAAPVYELGEAKAVAAVIKMRDQFVFLGQAIEAFIAGPWKDPHIGPMLEKGFADPTPGYRKAYKDAAENAEIQFAKNAIARTESIQAAFKEIQTALR
ncbi:hypothetical protein [Herbaspirillum huttiense]|uniref:hypothetical protein n=1 Tax=Herbaspirillum huttiense TaxID=863372 RepID=UPI002E7A06FD|nr:hypothetical protein [Herbaspirillum huttiense]MEE1636214.1 hypothetical protein [Herbaspirillum huttiense NC40101]